MPRTSPLLIRDVRQGAFTRLIRSEFFVLILAAGWASVMVLIAPGFGSAANATNLLASLLPLLVLATGQTLVLVSGGIDLSLTSTIAICSVVGGVVMNSASGVLAGSAAAVPVGIAAMLATGAAVGACNGLAVTLARMPPFIVTLATMMFVGGLAIWLTDSHAVSGLPESFNAIGNHLGVTLFLSAGFAVAAQLALSRTVFGRWLYSVGHNVRAATVSGVPVQRVCTTVYIASGTCAALAAIIYTGRLETASPVLGQRLLLDVIGATVIGGTSLYGGRGKITWTFYGVLFFTLIDNSLNLLNFSHFAIMMVKGGVILLAALLDRLRQAGGPAR